MKWQYPVIACLAGLCIILFIQLDKTYDQLTLCQTKLQTQTNRADSLDAELYPVSIELNRYQVAYEIFLRRDPQGAEMYGNIISDETE